MAKKADADQENKNKAKGCLVIFGVIGVIAAAFGVYVATFEPPSAEEEQAAHEAKMDAFLAECAGDAPCYYDKVAYLADRRCKTMIEGFAQYDARWGDGSPFSRAGWADDEKKVLNLLGDNAQFQNGFGAFARVGYSCTFNAHARRALNAQVEEGGL
ncbi:MAG: hypothetical protein AAF360_06080 [Pseudomonadota bacterium]